MSDLCKNCFCVEHEQTKLKILNNKDRGGGISCSGSDSCGDKGFRRIGYANRVYISNVENQTTKQANHVLTNQDRDGVF